MFRFLKQSDLHENLDAVYEKDIDSFFEKLGIKVSLDNGEYVCYCCKTTITPENFRAVTKKDCRLLFSCTKDACVMKLASDTKD